MEEILKSKHVSKSEQSAVVGGVMWGGFTKIYYV